MTNVLFIGSGDLGIQCLKAIEEQDSTIDVLTYDGDILAGMETELPVYSTVNMKKTVKGILKIPDHGIDYLVIAGVNVSFGPKTRSRVKGILRVHESLLPAYDGPDPLVWAMLNGEKRAGVSLVFTGPDGVPHLVDQYSFGIGDLDYISDVMTKAENIAPRLLRKHYVDCINQRAEFKEWPTDGGSCCTPCGPEDGKIDWNRPAQQVYNFIRAQALPYHMAFTYFPTDGGIPYLMKINRASICQMPFIGVPGEIVTRGDDVMVICGDQHALLLEEAFLGGKLLKPTSKMKYKVLV